MKTLVVLLALITLVSCNDKKKPDPEEIAAPELNGQWVSDCLPNTTAYSGPLGEKRIVTIAGTTVTTKSILFKDESCSNAQTQLTLFKYATVSFENLSREGQNTGFYSIDERINSFSIIPANPDYADVLTRNEYCAIRKWQAGKEYDVTGKVCGQQNQFAAISRYNILKFDQTTNPHTFALGRYTNNENGSSPQSRPKSLSGDLHYRTNSP